MLGTHILFIAPNFFGYEQSIISELERRGAKVDFMAATPFKSSILKALIRLRRKWVVPLLTNLFIRNVKRYKARSYDYVFVIKGEALSRAFLSWLNQQHEAATFILYLWDSLDNTPSLTENLKFFDHCFTFDPQDAKRYKLRYRALFFENGYEQKREKKFDYAISFIGTAHSDRYLVTSKIIKKLPTDKKYFIFYFLQAPWVFYLRKLLGFFPGANRDDFCFSPMTKQGVQSVFEESLAIIDVEHPKQRGLTMRCFEAVGGEKKIITTNKFIAQEDFYCEENILIVDRKGEFNMPDDFFDKPYRHLPAGLYFKYSLSGWIDEIFNQT